MAFAWRAGRWGTEAHPAGRLRRLRSGAVRWRGGVEQIVHDSDSGSLRCGSSLLCPCPVTTLLPSSCRLASPHVSRVAAALHAGSLRKQIKFCRHKVYEFTIYASKDLGYEKTFETEEMCKLAKLHGEVPVCLSSGI